MENTLITLVNNCASLKDVKNVILLNEKLLTCQTRNWSLYKIIEHCNQTIEYSMIGYPIKKNILVRNTLGRIAISIFLQRNKMSHNLQAPVPGAPEIPDDGNVEQSIKRLIKTIDTFNSYEKELKPHAFFGKLSKANYDKYFVLHIKDHFSEII